MIEYLDWWGYLILAVLPGAGFVFGVAWARREFRAGRDPMISSESWWSRRRRRHRLVVAAEEHEERLQAADRASGRVLHHGERSAVIGTRFPTPV